VIKVFSTMYIEVIRGVPLISVLFMALLMIPLFLPPSIRLDSVLRAMIGMTLFSAAYVAENVRGGLQAIPKGQYEAGRAVGLNEALVMALIVLPQALRAMIPAIVGQFISLYKDTTLVVIMGLLDILGMGKAVTGQTQWIGTQKEVYAFVGVVFFITCSAMSYASRRLEKRLGLGER
jgi:general L-amino acid transport system permease protein